MMFAWMVHEHIKSYVRNVQSDHGTATLQVSMPSPGFLSLVLHCHKTGTDDNIDIGEAHVLCRSRG
jgi:hypothetical protein